MEITTERLSPFYLSTKYHLCFVLYLALVTFKMIKLVNFESCFVQLYLE